MRYRIPPRLSGKPYSRVRLEFSPDKGYRDLSPPKLPIYLRSLFRSGFAVSSLLTCRRRPRIGFLFVAWRILA